MKTKTKKLTKRQIQNRETKIDQLEIEDAELKQVYSKLRSMKKRAEITVKIWKISQEMKKLGYRDTPEYKRALKIVKHMIKTGGEK